MSVRPWVVTAIPLFFIAIVVAFAAWIVVEQFAVASDCKAVGGVTVKDWRGWNQCLEGVNK